MKDIYPLHRRFFPFCRNRLDTKTAHNAVIILQANTHKLVGNDASMQQVADGPMSQCRLYRIMRLSSLKIVGVDVPDDPRHNAFLTAQCSYIVITISGEHLLCYASCRVCPYNPKINCSRKSHQSFLHILGRRGRRPLQPK